MRISGTLLITTLQNAIASRASRTAVQRERCKSFARKKDNSGIISRRQLPSPMANRVGGRSDGQESVPDNEPDHAVYIPDPSRVTMLTERSARHLPHAIALFS